MYNFPPENRCLRRLVPKGSKRTTVEIIECKIRHGYYRSFQYDAYRFGNNTYYVSATSRDLNKFHFQVETGCFVHDRYGYHLVTEVTFADYPKYLIVNTRAVAADMFYANIDREKAVRVQKEYAAIK